VSALLELAGRCERAEGADRVLDGHIHATVFGWEMLWNEKLELFQYWKDERWIGLGSIPAYTASLDAALTLVPEGWAVERWQIWPGEPSSLDLLETKRTGDQWVRCDGWLGKVEAVAATPALALAAAALRARAAA
jgi:hypothetical protein